jgi:hypothetical protein
MRRHFLFRYSWYPQYFSGNLNDGQLPPDTDSAFLLPSIKPFSVPEATAAAAAAKKQTPIQHPSMLKQQQHN